MDHLRYPPKRIKTMGSDHLIALTFGTRVDKIGCVIGPWRIFFFERSQYHYVPGLLTEAKHKELLVLAAFEYLKAMHLD